MYTLDELISSPDYHNRHDDVQVDQFIVGMHGFTRYGMYRQALRQLMPMAVALADYYFAIEEAEIDVLSSSPHNSDEWEARERRALRRRRAQLHSWSLAKKVRNRVTEFARMYAIACSLHDEFKGLSDEERSRLTLEWRADLLRRDAAYEYLTSGKLSRGVWEHVMSLPREQRARLQSDLLSKDRLISWLYQRAEEPPEPDERYKIGEAEVRRMIDGLDLSRQLGGAGEAENASLRDALEDRAADGYCAHLY